MNILLIPNAILIPEEMQKKFGKVTPAIVPLGNKSMLENIYNRYTGIVDKIYIICHEQANNVEKIIKLRKLNIEIIYLDKIADLGYTIFKSIQYITEKNNQIERFYINFADSLVKGDFNNEISNDFAFTAKPEGSELWTYFKNSNGKITDLLDKKSLIHNPDLALKYKNIFVGVFCISKITVYNEILLESLETPNNYVDSFYIALKKYSYLVPIDFRNVTTWYDVGHSETYFKAKSGVAARSFNTIEIDDKRGILKKTSLNKEKLIDEIKWYLKLPDNIQYLTPRIYDYSLNFNNPYVIMEFYGYHTLHECYLYGDLPITKWREIFKKLLFIIEDMEQYKIKSDPETIKSSLLNIYIKKTFERINTLRNDRKFSCLFKENIIINKINYKTLNYYMKILPELVEKIIIKNQENYFNIIHGDLCFANILVEENHNFMRLIDPRGSFGSFDIYGDPNYEIAKLLHSLEGKYDFIIEDMFELEVSGSNIYFKLLEKRDASIQELFKEVFSEKMKHLLSIRLIEATLFLSMVPLHADFPKRQYAMLSTGIMLLEKVIRQYKNNEIISE